MFYVIYSALYCTVLGLLFKETSVCGDGFLLAMKILAAVTFVSDILFKLIRPLRESDTYRNTYGRSLTDRIQICGIFERFAKFISSLIRFVLLLPIIIYEAATLIKVAIPTTLPVQCTGFSKSRASSGTLLGLILFRFIEKATDYVVFGICSSTCDPNILQRYLRVADVLAALTTIMKFVFLFWLFILLSSIMKGNVIGLYEFVSISAIVPLLHFF